MKKFALALTAAAAMTTAAPVLADDAAADPFVSTQSLGVGATSVPALAIVGGIAFVVVVAGAADSSDDT